MESFSGVYLVKLLELFFTFFKDGRIENKNMVFTSYLHYGFLKMKNLGIFEKENTNCHKKSNWNRKIQRTLFKYQSVCSHSFNIYFGILKL